MEKRYGDKKKICSEKTDEENVQVERGEIGGMAERWRRRGCGRSDKERLHCRIMTAIHFILLRSLRCFFVFVCIVLSSLFAVHSQQQRDKHQGYLFPLFFIKEANSANRPFLEKLKGK